MSALNDRLRVLAQPQPGPQTLLIKCPVFEVFFGGARGGGKTFGMLLDWLQHQAEHGEHAFGMMVRRTFKQLEDTIGEAMRLFVPLGAVWSCTNADMQTFIFPNGAKLRMRHLENDADAENYQGHSYTRVYVEEITNFPMPGPIMKLMATLRSKHGVPVGFRATGNPGGPGHEWVKARYITPWPAGMQVLRDRWVNPFDASALITERVYIPSRITDNRYLGADYIARLHLVGGPKLVQAWLTGDWSVIEGAYFDNWSDYKHVIRPFSLAGRWLRFAAADWGSAKPFCFLWFAVVGDDQIIARPDGSRFIIPRGALICYREWYGIKQKTNNEIMPNVGLKLTVEQVAEGLKYRESAEPRDFNGHSAIKYRVLDPACWADTGGPCIAERFHAAGISFRPADNKRTNDPQRIGGWDMVRHRLDGDNGIPMLYFFSNCVHVCRTLPVLQHDEKNPEDLDTEAEDHAADALRYGCMSRPWIKAAEPEKPPALTPATAYGTIGIDLDELFRQSERGRIGRRPSQSARI